LSNVSVIITDLDNTLFDWVEIWFHSFNALVDRIAKDSNIPREQLLDEIREIHQRHGTSEYAFLIEEIPSLRSLHPYADLLQIYQPAIDDFRIARRRHLKLYPGVAETLKKMKRNGVLIIGYTESMAFYTNYRIRKLGLDGVIDYLYSPPDHELPNNLTEEQIRKYPASYYELKFTEHRHTPLGELKPNPDILNTIIKDVGAKASHCLYVGDSLMKDIAMAQCAGVQDAHALYGKAQHLPAYELLRRVTHWTPEQVEKEKVIVQNGSVHPTCTLTASFSEILAFFEFSPFFNRLGEERIGNVIKVWEKKLMFSNISTILR
jgi:FMN phosphatase YigB (HAD superfamily)